MSGRKAKQKRKDLADVWAAAMKEHFEKNLVMSTIDGSQVEVRERNDEDLYEIDTTDYNVSADVISIRVKLNLFNRVGVLVDSVAKEQMYTNGMDEDFINTHLEQVVEEYFLPIAEEHVKKIKHMEQEEEKMRRDMWMNAERAGRQLQKQADRLTATEMAAQQARATEQLRARQNQSQNALAQNRGFFKKRSGIKL